MLAALAGLFALSPLVDPGGTPVQLDEAIVLTNAKLVYLGALPYLDYINFIPPVSNWFYAAVFFVFGDVNVGLARWVTCLVVVLTSVLGYLALRRLLVSPWLAAIPGLVYAALCFPSWSIPLHHWLAVFLCALCFWLAVVALQQAGRLSLLFALSAGVVLGVTGLTVQTHGAILACLLLSLPTLFRVTQTDGAIRIPGADPRRFFIAVAVGLGCTACAFLLYLIATKSVSAFLDESLLFLFLQYRREGSQNSMSVLGDLSGRLQNLMQLKAAWWVRLGLLGGACSLLLAAGLTVAHNLFFSARLWRGQRGHLSAVATSLTTLMALALFLVRPDFFHIAFYLFLPLLVLVVCLPPSASSTRYLGRILYVLIFVGALGHLLVPIFQGARPSNVIARVQSPDSSLNQMPAVDAALVEQDSVLHFLRRYAKAHPKATLFATSNGISAYLLAMPPAVADIVVYPPGGHFTGPREFGRMVRSFRERPATVLLFRPAFHADLFLKPPVAACPEAQQLAAIFASKYTLLYRSSGAAIYVLSTAASAPR